MLNEGWRRTIDEGFNDPARRQWDGVITNEVADYDRRLGSTPGYVRVDATVIIAQIWVESGGPKGRVWNQRVMQIGNPGDSGFAALVGREGATSVVVRAELLTQIDDANRNRALLDAPELNIQAGIAYLFTRMALSDMGSVPVDDQVRHHTVDGTRRETAASIARQEGTTLDELRADNPGVNLGRLRGGEDLSFRQAHIGRRITGWRIFDEATIAARYNGGGDPAYAEKLRYVVGKLRGDQAGVGAGVGAQAGAGAAG